MATRKETALELLRKYDGKSPYMSWLRKDIIVNGKLDTLNDFKIDYIIRNYDFEPRIINRVTKIPTWYGENRQEAWGTDFLPKKLKIVSLIGETDSIYNCYVQYRQSVPPVMCFLPKRAVINNFLYEDYRLKTVDFQKYDDLSTAKDPTRKLQEHQKDAVKFLLTRKRCILADDMGLGKLLPNSSLIPTIDGFKKNGELIPGDMVFGSDGKPCNILKVFPHKDKEIYRVRFTDGTYEDCGLEHLWVVRDNNMIVRKKGWKVMSLQDMIDSGLKYRNGICKYQIPTTQPVQYDEKKFLIHPYILGALIGDGYLCGSSVVISIPDFDTETGERIKKWLIPGYRLRKKTGPACPQYIILRNEDNNDKKNYYRLEIKRLNLNIHGKDKFIPEEYKLASFSQRLDLLRGLMDTDGYITKERNKISYSTVSEQLALDVCELVRSLGGIARFHKYNHKNKGIEYTIAIQIKDNPFYLKRKADRYNPTFKSYCTKRIESAEYVRNEDATCILVDSPDHTYLASRNYTVTHNTTDLAVASIEGEFEHVLIICPTALKTNWKKELMWYVPEEDITIIDGFLGKKKEELEVFLGYEPGASKMKKGELLAEAKKRGKWKDNKYVIVNYDILDEVYTIPRARSEEGKRKELENNPMLRFMTDKHTALIVDEAHKLSNNKSTRYKIIKDLIKRANPDNVYLVTGTPITNNALNFYYILNLIENEITSDYKYYCETYCDAHEQLAKGEWKFWFNEYLKLKGKTSYGQLDNKERDEIKEYIWEHGKKILVADGSSNLDELLERSAHIYLRRTKRDLVLPKKTIHEMRYNLSDAQIDEYERLWDEYEKQQLDLDPTKEINRDLLEGGLYRRYLSNAMVPYTKKLCNRLIAKGDKVVIACCYDEELYTLQEYYGDSCVIFNGKMSLRQKDEAVTKFMTDKSVLVFIGNITAAGVGITLTQSHYLIFNNISYVPGDNQQMQDRVHRISQTHDVDIYYQFFRGTQYEHMWDLVLKKSLVIDSVIKDETEKELAVKQKKRTVEF